MDRKTVGTLIACIAFVWQLVIMRQAWVFREIVVGHIAACAEAVGRVVPQYSGAMMSAISAWWFWLACLFLLLTLVAVRASRKDIVWPSVSLISFAAIVQVILAQSFVAFAVVYKECSVELLLSSTG